MSDTRRKLTELNRCLCNELTEYFRCLDGHRAAGLYDMVISEVEKSLLATVMSYVKYNQSKAALILGISRNTLRKKLTQYTLIDR